MEICGNVSRWFWNETFWLPRGVTWEEIKPTAEKSYANFNDLSYPLPFAILFIVVRKVYERIILRTLGRYFGIKDKIRRAPSNVILERAFQKNGNVAHKQIQGLAKQLDWSERKVERWLRHRVKQSKPSTLDKFTESGWKFTFYLCIFIYGMYSLWDKSWLWDSKDCWRDYPKHEISPDTWWHYMVSSSFYWSLMISQFMDVKRKDFWEMFVHHLITIFLLWFSWSTNMTRIGTLVLVVHDFADPFLEAAKMSKYVNNERLCNILFVLFTVAWIISRLIVYPYVVLYCSLISADEVLYAGLETYNVFPAYYVFNVFLCSLQLLHIVWTFFILRVLRVAFFAGKLVKDERSESSTVSELSCEELKEKKK